MIIPMVLERFSDDCGFSPFGDDVSTARETAFARIRARAEVAELAGERLG